MLVIFFKLLVHSMSIQHLSNIQSINSHSTPIQYRLNHSSFNIYSTSTPPLFIQHLSNIDSFNTLHFNTYPISTHSTPSTLTSIQHLSNIDSFNTLQIKTPSTMDQPLSPLEPLDPHKLRKSLSNPPPYPSFQETWSLTNNSPPALHTR